MVGNDEMMSSYNKLLSIYACLNQGGIIISTYDIPVLQKHSKFERMRGCNYKKGNLSNGWLQLNFRINSIPLKKE